MADSVNLFDVTAAHAADTEFFVRRGMTKGYELVSLLAPPAYAAFAISRYGRSHVTVNRLLRATWVGGSVGILGGGAFEYVRSAYSTPENVRNRRLVATYDTDSIRADDHSTIGGILGALLVPAIFWKRAIRVHLILGGAGLGSAVGYVAHHTRSLFGDPPPPARIPGLIANH